MPDSCVPAGTLAGSTVIVTRARLAGGDRQACRHPSSTHRRATSTDSGPGPPSPPPGVVSCIVASSATVTSASLRFVYSIVRSTGVGLLAPREHAEVARARRDDAARRSRHRRRSHRCRPGRACSRRRRRCSRAPPRSCAAVYSGCRCLTIAAAPDDVRRGHRGAAHRDVRALAGAVGGARGGDVVAGTGEVGLHRAGARQRTLAREVRERAAGVVDRADGEGILGRAGRADGLGSARVARGDDEQRAGLFRDAG